MSTEFERMGLPSTEDLIRVRVEGMKHRPVDDIMPDSGRQEAIRESRCVPPDIGCGEVVRATDFRDQLSLTEYGISGFCQKCQDRVFGTGEPT